MSDILEERLQHECYKWFHNEYPNLRGLLNCNKNNSVNKIDGNKWKAMGLQAGRADMVFYFKRQAFHIELKTEEGSQSKAQEEWQRLIEEQRFKYFVIRSLEEFKSIINEIIRAYN